MVQISIRYDSGYLTCSKKLTGSQLSLPHGPPGVTPNRGMGPREALFVKLL